jgi:two-component system chemotaxis sensor kinase CheA
VAPVKQAAKPPAATAVKTSPENNVTKKVEQKAAATTPVTESVAPAAKVSAPVVEPTPALLAFETAPAEAEPAPASDVSAAPVAEAGNDPAASANKGEQYSIRVETSRLDYLMDMVGELVIAESLVRNEVITNEQQNSPLLRSITQLAQITSEVQRTTFRMRMVPIGQLLRRTARIVRDLSRKCGKHVEVVFEGEETEVDKTIAEELADPLMHIVRNAVDHGIEMPADRVKTGKPQVARIRLAASHDGSQIVIEASDDGRGLDRTRILNKALEKNLIQDTNLSEAEIVDLIFRPGFSTAEKVTTVSGRGVGMDVVRKQVEKLRGRVDVESTPGSGTVFSIRLPLTRAIIDGLVVKVGGSRYVLPMSCVREIFRPAETAVSTLHGRGEMVLLHDHLMPLVRLHRDFGIETRITDPWMAVLIVAEADGQRYCLMVDELIGKQEVVVKSLGHFLQSTPGVSGGTILGDGRVGLILDVQQLEVRA